ncbi:MAG: transcription-repair coupling factor [Ignavibacteria bacterium]|nr:transcription-repair coupling factor [Ignavibacteria bacterium]
MLESIRNRIVDSEPFRRLREGIATAHPGEALAIRGASGSLMAFVATHIHEQRHQQTVLIVSDDDRAEQLRDDCALLIGDHGVRLYGHGPGHRATLLDMTAPIAQVETLKSLTNGDQVLVITSAQALASRVPLPERFRQRSLQLNAGRSHPFEELVETLGNLGFERKDFVEEHGDFSVRGGILDVYPYVGDHPLRIEFWGDTVESVREFDVLSQRSIRELQSANIVASLEPDGDAEPSGSLFDYLDPDAILVVEEPVLIQREIEELVHEGIQNILTWETLEQLVARHARVIQSSLFDQADKQQPALFVDFLGSLQPPSHGSMRFLIRHIRELTGQGLEVYIACDTKEEGERLGELIEEELTSPESPRPERESPSVDLLQDGAVTYRLMREAVHSGFVYPPSGLALLTEHEVFGRLKRRGLGKRRKFKGFTLKEAQQLQRGDYVVHVDYGIGKFSRLEKIRLRGVEQEVMKLLYDENDILYVNLSFVNRVQKYASREGHVPKLTKLGAPDWERLKSRARRRIKDIARELIQLYARRKHENGFAFASDTHWQKELEASFMFEDTPDQAKATADAKRDMEHPSPMDRLICGDVGFGKTEVAVRAAFKAVMSGKQVSVLVPTTILAQQHFNTFMDRLGRYSVRVECLTRFKAKKEQTEILHGLETGTVDIIIGTHRLLSKDIRFKDLGLLVIDEEHRFGVSAKEKLRQLRATVDTMAMTATPIPRTLQFSLMGARDLSLINTPPRNRLPIITEIAQYDPQLIREAVLKELHRSGQIYFIHDRVHDIEDIQAFLKRTIPEARFLIAHGQMKGHDLEKSMMSFLERKVDVLICTKIIESGIDIPSVNTIIINRSDRFGLAELYQLRGRVGRSNEQAYAYLLIPPVSSLPRATIRRLQALQEFTELGSGFNLAMRDLEIRGAGNLLGAEQSGFIMEMGFEMYQRIVEEAVAELKRQEFDSLFEPERVDVRRKTVETVVEADVEAFIPDFFIESDGERLDFYRRLYKATSLEEIQSMRDELQDRFGEYPEEVEHLLLLVELKVLAARIGFTKVELQNNELSLHLPSPDIEEFYERTDGTIPPFQAITSRIGDLKRYRANLKQEGKKLKLVTRVDHHEHPRARIAEVRELLAMLG